MINQKLKLKSKCALLMALIFFGFSQLASAQDQTIQGSVKSDLGEPLPGVTIIAKGTNKGAVTDFDGNYEISVSNSVTTLSFSYIGFTDQDVVIGGRTSIEVILITSVSELDQVVVVGYGTQARRDVTGAISSVKAAEIERTINTSIGDALQGKIAGVQIQSEDGTPGGAFKVNIRGAAAITGSTQPLYVIDGFPVEVFDDDPDTDTGYEGGGSSSPLDFLDASTIESIDILKDASATAIYGARGANGVVIITTKQGKKGELKVSYTNSTSITTVPDSRIPNMLSTAEWFDYEIAKDYYGDSNRSWNETDQVWEYVNPDISSFTYNNPYPEVEGEEEPLTRDQWISKLPYTDWAREILRTSLVANHIIGLSGGTDKTKFNAVASYFKNEGVVVGSGYDRFVLNLNLKQKIGKRANAQVVFSPNYSKQFGTGGGGSSVRNSWGFFSKTLNSAPFALRGDDGARSIPSDNEDDNEIIYNDPVYQAENTINNRYKYGYRANLKLDYKILDNLTFVTNIGYSYAKQEQRVFNPPTFGIGANARVSGRARRLDKKNTTFNNSNTLNYKNKFGKHRINALVGFEQNSKNTNNLTLVANGFELDVLDGSLSDQFRLADRFSAPRERIQEINKIGYLSRVNYSYDNRYSLTGTFRRDGDSRFIGKSTYRNFPSAAFSWTASNENFMSNLNAVDHLKFRVSYGLGGNSGVRPRFSRENFGPFTYSFGDEVLTGLGARQIIDASLTWQTIKQFDTGLDLTLFNNRINIVADYYKKETIDMILDQGLGLNVGANSWRTNAGDLKNWGYELTLKTENIKAEKFNWSTHITFAADRSKVLDLGGPEIQTFKERLTGGNSGALLLGENIGTWLGYKMDGVYNTWEEIEADPITRNIRGDILQPGDPKYIDVSGDGRISDDDITIIAQTQPKFHGGVWNNFQIGDFEIGAFLTFKYDFDVINGDRLKHTYHSRGGGNIMYSSALYDAWSPDNPDSVHPGYHIDAGSSTLPLSTYHVEDGSFLRLQNISFKYTFPKSVMDKTFFRSMEISFNIINAKLWTNYSGIDPENNNNRGQFAKLAPNLDWGAYPRPRSWNTTLKVGF